MRLADFFPVGDLDDVHAGAHYVLHAGSSLLQGAFDIFQRLHGLRIDVADANYFSIVSSRGGAGYVDVSSDSDGTRVTDDGLPRSPTGDQLSFHVLLPEEKFYRFRNA